MKLYIISDTHGELDNINEFIEIIGSTKYDLVIHLGDDSVDCKIFEDNGIEHITVPGMYEPSYSLKETKRRQIVVLDNYKFLLTHTLQKNHNDLEGETPPEELIKTVDFVLYGHTHIPEIKIVEGQKINAEKEKVIFINPGHLKTEDKRGYEATFCEIEISCSEIKIVIKTLNGLKVLFEEKINLR